MCFFIHFIKKNIFHRNQWLNHCWRHMSITKLQFKNIWQNIPQQFHTSKGEKSHINLFLSDHSLNLILLIKSYEPVSERPSACAGELAPPPPCLQTRISWFSPKKRKEKLGFEFGNIKRLIPSPLFCSISSSFLMLSSLAVNVCFCVSIRISNSCEDLEDVLQPQSKTYLEACFFVHPSVPYWYFR